VSHEPKANVKLISCSLILRKKLSGN